MALEAPQKAMSSSSILVPSGQDLKYQAFTRFMTLLVYSSSASGEAL